MQSLAHWQSVRYGLGPKLGTRPEGDLSDAMLEELVAPAAGWPGLASGSDGLAAIRLAREMRRDGTNGQPEAAHPVRAILRADRVATLRGAIDAEYGYRERLIGFWANHFTVSIRQGGCAALAGAFRREAIEPHLTGRFSDMLLAAMRHPAMLRYLDNARSVGPHSATGLRTGHGLNENLARESLELHTLGSDGGYDQADVTSYAAILTGWSVQAQELPYGFTFRPQAHEPGAKTLLGRRFPDGEQGGIEALAFLAGHSATARHLAGKLACHFVGDDPSPAEIAAIASTFEASGGDLGEVARHLLAAGAGRRRLAKLRSPQDLVTATYRAFGMAADGRPEAAPMSAALGQELFAAPLPNGWPDRSADWLGADAMLRRVDFAYSVAGHADPSIDPVAVAETSLGGLIRPSTLHAVAHAGSRREALTLLVASPEFQRR